MTLPASFSSHFPQPYKTRVFLRSAPAVLLASALSRLVTGHEGKTGAISLNGSYGLNNHLWFYRWGCKQPKPLTAASNQKLEQIDMPPKHSSPLEPETCPFPTQGGQQLKSHLSVKEEHITKLSRIFSWLKKAVFPHTVFLPLWRGRKNEGRNHMWQMQTTALPGEVTPQL